MIANVRYQHPALMSSSAVIPMMQRAFVFALILLISFSLSVMPCAADGEPVAPGGAALVERKPEETPQQATERLGALDQHVEQLEMIEGVRGRQAVADTGDQRALSPTDNDPSDGVLGGSVEESKGLGVMIINGDPWFYLQPDRGSQSDPMTADVATSKFSDPVLLEMVSELHRHDFYAGISAEEGGGHQDPAELREQVAQSHFAGAELDAEFQVSFELSLTLLSDLQLHQSAAAYQAANQRYYEVMADRLLQGSEYWWDGGGDPAGLFRRTDGSIDHRGVVRYAFDRLFRKPSGSTAAGSPSSADMLAPSAQAGTVGHQSSATFASEILRQSLQLNQEVIGSVRTVYRRRVVELVKELWKELRRESERQRASSSAGFMKGFLGGVDKTSGRAGGDTLGRGDEGIRGEHSDDAFAERSWAGVSMLRSLRSGEVSIVDDPEAPGDDVEDLSVVDRRLVVEEPSKVLPVLQERSIKDLFRDGGDISESEVQPQRVAELPEEERDIEAILRHESEWRKAIMEPALEQYRSRVRLAEERFLDAVRAWVAIKAATYGSLDGFADGEALADLLGGAFMSGGQLSGRDAVLAHPEDDAASAAVQRAAEEVRHAHQFLVRLEQEVWGVYQRDTQPYYDALASRLLQREELWRQGYENAFGAFAGTDGVVDAQEKRQLVQRVLTTLHERSRRLTEDDGGVGASRVRDTGGNSLAEILRQESMLLERVLGPARVRLSTRLREGEDQFWVMVLRGVAAADIMESMVVHSDGRATVVLVLPGVEGSASNVW